MDVSLLYHSLLSKRDFVLGISIKFISTHLLAMKSTFEGVK